MRYIDAPLPPMKVSFRDAKKMKGGSDLAKKILIEKNSVIPPEWIQNADDRGQSNGLRAHGSRLDLFL